LGNEIAIVDVSYFVAGNTFHARYAGCPLSAAYDLLLIIVQML
jgi:hypothetical protein